MALTINTNVSSIRTNRAIEATQRELSRSVQRISSGVRLNSAKDDPAGLATSDRLSVQIRGISMAIRNANDGIGLAQTAEGSLQELTGMVQRIQELSVQASNPSSSVSTRSLLHAEVTQLNAEITRISEQTEFNGQKILSGVIINANFQVGVRPEETVNLSIPEMASTNLGNFFIASSSVEENSMGAVRVSDFSGEAPRNFVTEQSLTVRGFNTASVAPEVLIGFEESSQAIAQKMNNVEPLTGVKATAKTTLTMEGIYSDAVAGTQNLSFRLYGKNKKEIDSTTNAAFISANIKDDTEQGLRSLVSAVNAQKSVTGITASFAVTLNGDGAIILENDTGEDISLEAFSNTSPSETPESAPSTLRVRGARGTPEQTLTEGTAEDSVTVGGVITLNSPKPFAVSPSITAQEGSLFQNVAANEPQASRFNSLLNVDISTLEGAAGAIDIAANALEQITGLRSELGAVQNRFETAISNLQSVQENTQDARSRIMDTDFAEEVSRFTRAQILQQAGIAILAQANAAPFSVLELLRT